MILQASFTKHLTNSNSNNRSCVLSCFYIPDNIKRFIYGSKFSFQSNLSG